MDFYEQGAFIDKIIQNGAQNEQELAKSVDNLLEMIHTYHTEHGMAHLDLKLENILLSKEGLRLCDFGMADKINGKIDHFRGTAGYMAPEILLGDKYDPVQADLFALAVIIFIL